MATAAEIFNQFVSNNPAKFLRTRGGLKACNTMSRTLALTDLMRASVCHGAHGFPDDICKAPIATSEKLGAYGSKSGGFILNLQDAASAKITARRYPVSASVFEGCAHWVLVNAPGFGLVAMSLEEAFVRGLREVCFPPVDLS